MLQHLADVQEVPVYLHSATTCSFGMGGTATADLEMTSRSALSCPRCAPLRYSSRQQPFMACHLALWSLQPNRMHLSRPVARAYRLRCCASMSGAHERDPVLLRLNNGCGCCDEG